MSKRSYNPTDEEEKLAEQLANKLLLDAFLENSSDIHITPTLTDTVIRYRIDGVLQEVSRHSHQAVASLIRVVKQMAALDPEITTAPQDGAVQLSVDARRHYLRLGTMPTYYGEAVTLRVLDPIDADSLLSGGPAALGFVGEDLQRIETMMTRPYGLVLFTGPTGCGKTTSILACLGQMAARLAGRSSIMTLEDPIERPIDGVLQTAVHSQGEFNYVRAIKAALRHDLDVLYCGEIQNADTSRLLVQVALTGHLVISQLHAADVPHALKLLADLGTEPYLLGMALEGIVAQRLVRTLCTHCRTQTENRPELLSQFQPDCDVDRLRVTWHRRGCDRCKQTGYRGRTVISETMPRDERVCDLLNRGLSVGELRTEMRRMGYRSLQQDALDKVVSGVTSLEEAIRSAYV